MILPLSQIVQGLSGSVKTGVLGSEALEVDGHPDRVLLGDASIARFLAKRGALYGDDPFEECEIEEWMTLFALGRVSAGMLEDHLTKRTFLVGSRLSLADVAAYVFLYCSPASAKHPAVGAATRRWTQTMEASNNSFLETKKASTSSSSSTAKKSGGGGLAGKSKCPILEGDPDPSTVVTRFPPEPSGYLHIGHCKALFLNLYYAKEYQGVGGGKLLLRFDDTNPATEKGEYETAILEDLKLLNVTPDAVSHTSDFFDEIIKRATKLVQKGLAYVDWSSQEELALQRGRATGVRVPSPCRENSVEENLRLWEILLKGETAMVKPPSAPAEAPPQARALVLRAKITDEKGTPGYLCGNGSMRDPVLFRVVLKPPHAKTGTKYKAYPTYDMACPIVDSLEGVTHVMRDSQYADRAEQYHWLQRAMELRPCKLQMFSRVNFQRTLMSKRKLAALVEEGVAAGWDDPRFPTIRGILRRGMTVESLKEFMLALGGSMRACDMEWDKIWSDNMRLLDARAPRFMGVDEESKTAIELVNFNAHHKPSSPDEIVAVSVPMHPKDPSMGVKSVMVTPRIFVEAEDVKGLAVGMIVGLMRYAVITITSLAPLRGEILENGDFKSCERLVTWVSSSPHEARVAAWEHDFLLLKGNDEEEPTAEGGGEEDDQQQQQQQGKGGGELKKDESWKKNINYNSVAKSILIVNAGVRLMQKGDVIQLERRGLFRVDVPASGRPDEKEEVHLIKIPDGKQKANSLAGKLEHR